MSATVGYMEYDRSIDLRNISIKKELSNKIYIE